MPAPQRLYRNAVWCRYENGMRHALSMLNPSTALAVEVLQTGNRLI